MRQHGLQLGSIVAAMVLGCLVAAFGALIGCASSMRLPVRTVVQPFSADQRATWESARAARYHLRVGDTFAVDFKYQDGLDQKNITVLPDGRFTMAGMDSDVRVVGMTIPQVDSLITAHFARDYRDPELSIVIQELGRQRVHVLGEVRLPGTYDLPPGTQTGGVLQAIALAGGFTVNAATSEAVVIRVSDQGWTYRHCDLSHLEKQPLQDTAYLDLQPYDIVYVPRGAIGDWAVFADRFLPGLGNISNLFWDVYAVTHLEKLSLVTR